MNNSGLISPASSPESGIRRITEVVDSHGSFHLKNLPSGLLLEVQTGNHWYTIIPQEPGKFIVWGHPELCPDPVIVTRLGSTNGGALFLEDEIVPGMRLTFRHPEHRITTSRIAAIRAKARN
jgi:hypothetical protein